MIPINGNILVERLQTSEVIASGIVLQQNETAKTIVKAKVLSLGITSSNEIRVGDVVYFERGHGEQLEDDNQLLVYLDDILCVEESQQPN